MATNYIALKTILSFVTGLVVAVILLILQVKLAVMWGILSFVLNFIPNVGSMIAMFLPMPVVLVDKNLADWQKVGAFVGPGAVQGYVGNALEPMVFGKSLNMTPLSILMALVTWTSLWGIMGAILSVCTARYYVSHCAAVLIQFVPAGAFAWGPENRVRTRQSPNGKIFYHSYS